MSETRNRPPRRPRRIVGAEPTRPDPNAPIIWACRGCFFDQTCEDARRRPGISPVARCALKSMRFSVGGAFLASQKEARP